MKLEVLQEDLSLALNNAIRFISTRSTLPVLGNFLLVAEKAKLKITATNLEMSIAVSVGAKIEEEGKTTVPAKVFQEIVTSLNKGAINLSLEKEKLSIITNKFSADLETFPANDFPAVPDEIDNEKAFSLSSKSLVNTLSKILFSVSTDESRPTLTGVLFNFEGDVLSLVATDGFRLSKKSLKLNKGEEIKNLIIPKNSLLELIKLSKDIDNILLEIKSDDNQLIIKIGDNYLTSRLIEGKFPEYQKIIPASSPIIANVDKNDLSRGVNLASIFAKDTNNIIKLNFDEKNIIVSSESGKVGKETSNLEANVEGGKVEVLFNFKFIQDFLNVVIGDIVEIKLLDAVSPVIFIDPKDENFLHLIMPVRIQS